VVGCGRVAQQAHLPVLARDRRVELIALAESDEAQLRAAARHAPRAALFADWRELFERSDVEALIICLPNALHAEAARAALALGRHVYLEKPVATNLADARAVVEAWRRAPHAVGMLGFNYRFNRLYEGARAHVHAGRLGELISARTIFSTAEGEGQPAWKRVRAQGGGALLDLGSHHVDLLRFVFDREVREVSAQIWSRHAEDDCAALQLRLDGGLTVQSLFSTCAVEEDGLEVYGSAGKLSFDRYRSTPPPRLSNATLRGARLNQLGHALGALRHGAYSLEKLRAPAREPSFTKALGAFVSAALTGERDAKPDLEDGFRSLEVIDAAERSARERRVVAVATDDSRAG
jgi:predicted dehydrogenase